jgi:putative membrane protein insertion efficiency factor
VKTLSNLIKKPFLLLIRVYQKLFSFDHSFWARPDKIRMCIYYPSCSEYTYQAIDKFGLIKGSILGIWRVIRCNPLSEGGVDNVPDKFEIFNKKKHKH